MVRIITHEIADLIYDMREDSVKNTIRQVRNVYGVAASECVIKSYRRAPFEEVIKLDKAKRERPEIKESRRRHRETYMTVPEHRIHRKNYENERAKKPENRERRLVYGNSGFVGIQILHETRASMDKNELSHQVSEMTGVNVSPSILEKRIMEIHNKFPKKNSPVIIKGDVYKPNNNSPYRFAFYNLDPLDRLI